MRSLQGSADTELDQSMGRKAARLARRPHVVGSVALDQRLRAELGVGEDDLKVVVDKIEGTKAHFKPTGGVPPLHYDFGDGNEHDPSDGRNTAHTYEGPGEYVVEVTDAEGHVDTLFLNIEAPEPVTSPLVLVVDRIEGMKAHFKPTGGVEPITYDFGDGTTHTPSDGRNTSHTYAAPGEYEVTITDADLEGDEAVIEIEGDPAATSLPWDTMTTHAQIDGWAEAQGVPVKAEWGQMTIASKRAFLANYFGEARPWEVKD